MLMRRHSSRTGSIVRTLFVCALAAGAVFSPTQACAGTSPPDYGMQWCTVSDPGNRLPNAAEAGEAWAGVQYPYGRVNHTYRLTKTEVTNAQYIEFIRAYLVFKPGVTNLTGISGYDIEVWGGGASHNNANPNFAANMSWEYAARFCNWLHNDKAMTLDAFERGVYDTSTFYIDSQGVPQHQVTPAAGARFWMPTVDEWVKAAYWDPSKNNGAGGYWTRPNGTDTPLIPGIPGWTPGAQTSAGAGVEPPVGFYPDVTSPWGLLDMSGGMAEFTSSIRERRPGSGVLVAGADIGSQDHERFASGFGERNWGSVSGQMGLRLASIVPSPSVVVSITTPLALLSFSRRRS